MIDHVSIRVSDVKKSAEFYEKVLGTIGYKKIVEFDEGVGFGVGQHIRSAELSISSPDSSMIWIIQEGKEDPLTKNVHVGFRVADVETVKKFYDTALAAGGKNNGAPGKCPEYGDTYYGGFVLDMDGNNIEAVTHVKE
ncbi:MAG TPA: VOC family protein [Candidatus Paceibacterota bacterium]